LTIILAALFQVERVEPFGEPAVDWSKKLASILSLSLIAPKRAMRCGSGRTFLRCCVHIPVRAEELLELSYVCEEVANDIEDRMTAGRGMYAHRAASPWHVRRLTRSTPPATPSPLSKNDLSLATQFRSVTRCCCDSKLNLRRAPGIQSLIRSIWHAPAAGYETRLSRSLP
jgi:hypothetical protein